MESQKANTTTEQDSIALFWNEILDQIGQLSKKVEIMMQGKEIHGLKSTNVELKISNADSELKTNINLLLKKADLRDEEIVRVKASNTKLKVSNEKVAATLARVSLTESFAKYLPINLPPIKHTKII